MNLLYNQKTILSDGFLHGGPEVTINDPPLAIINELSVV